MAGEKRFTRIPPESTGDRLYMVHTAEIEFNNKGNYDAAQSYEWQLGKRYTIAGFGLVHVHGVFDRGDGTGILAVHYNKTAKFENLEPTAGAKIQYDIDNDDVLENVADVVNAYDVYIPTQHIMGYDNPEYGLDVDNFGAANVRFFEGQPQLDAWGKLRTSGAQMLGNYVFGGEAKLRDNFSQVELDTGYVTYDNTRNSVQVGFNHVGATAATFAGNTSNTYHPYIPGSSHLWQGTFLLNSPETGDGTNGAIRRWGLFDAENGFYFKVGKDGNTAGTASTSNEGFCVVIRTSTSGSVTETIIPQDDFNGDKLNGKGRSQETFDLSKNNQYWIDIQWHGAGRVRFGTYLNGQRIIMHTYFAGNIETAAMSQTASLPSCTSIKSAGTPLTSLYVETWAQSVWSETELTPTEFGKPAAYASNHATITANISDDWQYLFSLSPNEVIGTKADHALFMPTSVSAYGFDNSVTNGLNAVIDLKLEVNSILNHWNGTDIPNSNVEYSYPLAGDSAYEGGSIQLQEMFAGRYETETTDTFNNFQYGSVKNFSEDGGTKKNTITNISATNPAVITTGELLKFKTGEVHAVTFPLNASRYNGKLEINDLDNATTLNGQKFLIKPTGLTSAELYTDSDGSGNIDLATAVDGTALVGAGAQGAGTIKGFAGSRLTWNFYAKTRTALHTDVKLMVTVNWKEIIQ